MRKTTINRLFISTLLLTGGTLFAQDEVEELEEVTFEEEVPDPFGILPSRPIDSVFGIPKSQLEIPRSIDVVEGDILDAYGIDSVGRISAVAAGAYTNNQFGIEGNVDVRNVEAENYFRGFKKLKNRGNFRTPIGAADRFELIKGIAPVQYGVGSVGGLLNYYPKTAKGENTKYLSEVEGKVALTVGTYSKFKTSVEAGVPYEIGGKRGGLYFYVEYEDSGSFYHHLGNDDQIYQLNITQDLTDTITLETGFQYADLSQIQNPGWNRVTQDLIDNKNYISGELTDQGLDLDGSGRISPYETDGGNGFAQFTNRIPGISADASGRIMVGDLTLDQWVAANAINQETGISLATLGDGTADSLEVVKISNKVGFTEPEDYGFGRNFTGYFDIKGNPGGLLTWKNQFFYDTYQTKRNTTYGFNNDYNSFVWEDRFTATIDPEGNEFFDGIYIIGVSIRNLDTDMKADYLTEPFDWRDLTKPVTANTRIERGVVPEDLYEAGFSYTDDPFTDDRYINYYDDIVETQYLDKGVFINGDMEFLEDILVNLGYSLHSIDMSTLNKGFLGRKDDGTPNFDGAESTDSYHALNASLSYRSPIGLIPYITYAESAALADGQASEVQPGVVSAGTYIQDSDLLEVGVKGKFLDERLVVSATLYQQNRSDYNSQLGAIVEEETEGLELSVKWAITDEFFATFALTAAQTRRSGATSLLGTGMGIVAAREGISLIEAYAKYGGLRFNSFGSTVLDETDPANPKLVQTNPLIAQFSDAGSEEPGRPDHNYSLYLNYKPKDFGLTATVGVEYYTSVKTGFINNDPLSDFEGVTLPEYYLVTMSIGYEITENFSVRANIDNVFDELDWYKSANLFFDNLVMPGSGREMSLTATYKF
jgi:iron complex outermembrane receptor protein